MWRHRQRERRGGLLFSSVRFNSRATEGLNIPVCARQAGLHCERGTVRKTAKNSSCNSRKLSQVVHQLVEQTEPDALRVTSLFCTTEDVYFIYIYIVFFLSCDS